MTIIVHPNEFAIDWRLRARLRAAGVYVLSAALCIVILFSFLHLWGEDLHVPIDSPAGDYLFEAMMVKNTLDSGWYLQNQRLGAPFDSELYDFPMSESAHLLVIKTIGLFSHDYALVTNIFYILTYVFAALLSLFVFRRLGIPTLPAIGAGLIFAFLPHHYLRGEYHLFLSAYYLIPLVVLVLLWLAEDKPMFDCRPEQKWKWRPTRAGWFSFGVCVLMGAGGVYYGFFAAIFFACVAVWRFRQSGRLFSIVPSLVLGAVMTVTLGLNIAPSVLFHLKHGSNRAVAARSPIEADAYGMKIAQLILPITDHRVKVLSNFKAKYLAMNGTVIPNNDLTVPLGAVASFGFICLLAISLWPSVRTPPGLPVLAMLNLSAVLVATIGGFGSIFAYLVSPDIRCYHRISVYIAFFSLSAVLLVFSSFSRAMNGRVQRSVSAGVVAIVMLLGVWEITPATGATTRQLIRANYSREHRFIRSVEAWLPSGAKVFELPYLPFPENGPIERMTDYDPLLGYLHSNQLRWSYGAIKGREAANWEAVVSTRTVPDMLLWLRGAGFKAILVDRNGYRDRAVGLCQRLSASIRQQPLQSEDGRFAVFRLP